VCEVHHGISDALFPARRLVAAYITVSPTYSQPHSNILSQNKERRGEKVVPAWLRREKWVVVEAQGCEGFFPPDARRTEAEPLPDKDRTVAEVCVCKCVRVCVVWSVDRGGFRREGWHVACRGPPPL
jgi:hypothetical protein